MAPELEFLKKTLEMIGFKDLLKETTVGDFKL